MGSVSPTQNEAPTPPNAEKPYPPYLIGLFLLAVVFFAGVFVGRSQRPSVELATGVINQELGKPETVDFSLFWDAWRVLEEKYAGRKDVNRQELLYGAISGMVKALGDPYTVFFKPEETKRFEEDISGSFEGIGAEIGIKKGTLTVIAPIAGSPAERAGLLAGDKILKIDDILTADLTIEEAVEKIRGPGGTQTKLLISRDSFKEPKEFSITRATIQIPVLKSAFFETPKGRITQLTIAHFTESLPPEFKREATNMLTNGTKGLILDLRNDPGGFLEVAVDIAGWVLPPQSVVAVEDFGNARRDEFKTTGSGRLANLPIVILINQGSASASEILAGALRDHRKVKLIGEKTFGKGSVQELERLREGASLKITVAKWLTPSGHSISDAGLDPDIVAERTEEDIEKDRDPQLEKAKEILREQL